jgi:potassium-transporting ATPase KdpC subunit
MLRELRTVAAIFLLLTLVTGIAYPLLVTAVAQIVFPHQANGSLIVRGDKLIGSELLGQGFSDPKYFWGRPSASAAFPYDASSSSGSNYGPTNPAQLEAVRTRLDALRKSQPEQSGPAPIELVTASASGLDPHVSPAAAEYQVGRVAAARSIGPEQVGNLVNEFTEGRTLGVLGEPRVNVLQLNLALDARFPAQK